MKKSLFLLLLVLSTSLLALQTDDRILKPNNVVEYLKTPGEAQSITEVFTKGQLYGRLRSNNFVYDYDEPDQLDNQISGIGGGITYKTAFYEGFGATLGLYASIPLGADNILCVGSKCINYTQSGKDLFQVDSHGTEHSMGVLAVGYGEWKNSENSFKAGRQIVETLLLSSNDAKMIPNTFEGLTFENSSLDKTLIKLGYLTQQKLRNHQTFHSILAYAPRDGNDDSGAHKGLSITNLQKANKDIDPEMLFATIDNNSIDALKLHGEYIGISGFYHTLIVEANPKITLLDGWALTPGIRYLAQFDDGAGAIGGAAISGKTSSAYTNPKSLDGSLLNARLALSKGAGSLTLGYSDVADKADIVAPWRGFPTRGYTRAMAQTNWYANTQSWMIAGIYDFDKEHIIDGLWCSTSYSHINIDDAKSNSLSVLSSDRDVIYADAIKSFHEFPNTEFKFRFADVNAKTVLSLPNTSYSEYRFEINYLF